MSNNKRDLYLSQAVTTVKYVQGKMEFGASNKFPNLAAAMCVGWGGMPGKMRQDVDKSLNAIQGGWNWKQRIDIEAYNAKSWGCGNCGEQASVAFAYLRGLNVLPLDYYQADTALTKHAFVIIGRDAGTNATDYRTWNKDAVVCDPWRGVADFVTAESSYFSGKTLTHHYREG